MTAEPTEYGDQLAVVTVTYSPGETLERFIETLAKATTRPVEVILADNGSVDGAPEAAATTHEHVTLVRTGGNLGYGSGANRGVAELGPEYGWIVIANPDLEWGEGSLDELLAATTRWPRGGSFGPLITERNGTVYPSAREVPSLGKGIGHAALGKVWPGNPWTRSYKQSATSLTERVAGWLSGSCLLIRRSAWDSVDGFDSRYFMYFEDVDLGERLTQTGWQNIYVPTAKVMHIQGVSTAKSSNVMLKAHHDSAYRYIADHHQGPLWAPLRWAVRAGLALRLRIESR
ncbi:glycosyltransferase family 2 protein [Actinokineospora sp. NBRC 105648]|uniref:glycosyltransferase family 2 protein n=1 Tax=Actinokineospora sp. NBRC 105648 TaxID=3032206 RepID=UPI0024A58554|nr:glycosyltransferase family 2 protein [Actinokineospora sp. NBRC 105648]GLZ38504.1 glycosyl transferase [Actinokineospora sp. NBRC 105648]